MKAYSRTNNYNEFNTICALNSKELKDFYMENDNKTIIKAIKKQTKEQKAQKSFERLCARCAKLVDKMPFETNSAIAFKRNILDCMNSSELFWTFFFELSIPTINKDMETRFPDVYREFNFLMAQNKKRHFGVRSIVMGE